MSDKTESTTGRYLPPQIESFSINLRLDCTIQANNSDWLKPGVSGSMSWKGIPTEEQITLAAEYIHRQVLEPTLRDALINISQRLEENRKG